MSVAARVIAVAEHMSGKEAYIDSDLVADLGLDSLDRIQLAIELEKQFGIEIPDEDVDRPELGTIRGLIAYVEQKLAPPPFLTRSIHSHLPAGHRPGAEL